MVFDRHVGYSEQSDQLMLVGLFSLIKRWESESYGETSS